jgi:hypothetical protein
MSLKTIPFTMPDGRVHRFEEVDANFIEMLQETLPTMDKICLMNISIENLDEFLIDENKRLAKILIPLFKTKWVDRACGDDFIFDDADINEELFGVKLTDKQILSKMKRGTFKIQELQTINNWFLKQDEISKKA